MDTLHRHYCDTARVPPTLRPQTFGLWRISRVHYPDPGAQAQVGYPTQTRLERYTEATAHRDRGTIVMDDSLPELARHLPIWRAADAHGPGTRMLVTGLGLGCVVRGLATLPSVAHIDVVEIDPNILRVVGTAFAEHPRITLHHADALTWEMPPERTWDYAWHDLWCEGSDLQVLHATLMQRYAPYCRAQGAWGFPRCFKRLWPVAQMLGRGRRQHDARFRLAKPFREERDHGLHGFTHAPCA